MSDCRTSAWNTRRAAARSCRPSTLCRASTPSRHCARSRPLHEQIAPLLMISEVRTIAADNLWMSPCYQQACVAIHFTWKLNWEAVRQLLARDRSAARAVRCPPALGQAVYHGAGAAALAVSEAAGFPTAAAHPTIHRANSAIRSWIPISLGLRVPRNNAGSRASGRRRRGSPGARAACPGCPAPRSAR